MNKKFLSVCAVALSCTLSFAQDLSTYSLYKGDTLQGFDIKACHDAALSMRLHGKEVITYMNREEMRFMAKKYHLADPTRRSGLTLPTVLTSSCNNVDFENGTFGGWTGGIGFNTNSTGPLTISSNIITGLGLNSPEPSDSYHTLVSTGTDPYTGLPMVDPGGGSFACRLGGEFVNIGGGPFNTGGPGGNGSGGEVLQQTFLVTPSNALFTYKYSVVMDQVTRSRSATLFPGGSSGHLW